MSALTQKLEELTLELKEATSARNEAKGDLVGKLEAALNGVDGW